MCSHSTFNKHWLLFHDVVYNFRHVSTSLFKIAGDLIYLAYLLRSWCISICSACCLSKSSGCCFQGVVTAHLTSSGCMSINVVLAVSLKGGFSFSNFVLLSQSSRYGFPCVLTAHLISSGLIFICHCFFTRQCMSMWFFTCFHCCLSKQSGCSFPYGVTALF